MKVDNLPTQYIPFEKITIGTNLLKKVNALISINGSIPLLIGKGSVPRVWLYIPANQEGTEWFPLIKDNFSSHKDVKVQVNSEKITIRIPEKIVLDCEIINKNELVINSLDLRPFGLDIVSNRDELKVTGNTLVGNTFSNISIVVDIGTA